MLVLCYPKCTTCQKALAWLDAHGLSYEIRNIKEQNPTAQELEQWHKQSGLPLKKFFNTSGQLYQKMGLKDKLGEMDEKAQYDLLAQDGMLVKRPILLLDDGRVLLGFKEGEWAAALEG